MDCRAVEAMRTRLGELRRERERWLEEHPRNDVDDAYTYGINVPAGRTTRWDEDIRVLEQAIGVLQRVKH